MKKVRTVLHKDAMGALINETWQFEEGDRDAFRAWATERAQDEPRTLEDMLAGVKKYVDHEMIADGWPASDTIIAYNRDQPEHWRSLASFDDAEPGEQSEWADFYVERTAEPLSRAWHLAKIAFSLRCIHSAQGAGRELALFRHGLKIGTYMQAAEMRRHHLKKAETGKKQRQYLDHLRDKKNRDARNAVQKRREAIALMIGQTDRTGGALDEWLKKELETRHKISVSLRTIREDRKTLRG